VNVPVAPLQEVVSELWMSLFLLFEVRLPTDFLSLFYGTIFTRITMYFHQNISKSKNPLFAMVFKICKVLSSA